MKIIRKILSVNALLHTLLILFFATTLISCSNNDTDDSESNTLLESLNNTTWKFQESDGFLRFMNNIDNPLEEWYINGANCYEHSFRAVIDDISVLENTKDIFTLKAINRDNRTVVMSFSKSGESLRVDIDKGELLTIFMSKTSENLDNLMICN
jgi:hypothetical protein